METTTEIRNRIAKAVSGYINITHEMGGYRESDFTEGESIVLVQVVCAICDHLGVTEGMSLAEVRDLIVECGLGRELAERVIGENGEDEWTYL